MADGGALQRTACFGASDKFDRFWGLPSVCGSSLSLMHNMMHAYRSGAKCCTMLINAPASICVLTDVFVWFIAP
jgi:hypothetical protein